MADRNVVLLATDSRESRSKQRHYAAAARTLGLSVRKYPDKHTVAVLPCSDFRAMDAAWLCKLHGIPGSDPIAANIASHKSLTYQFLHKRGFRTLYWQVPATREDLEHDFDRPVIVKPDRGSGSFSRHPWGYKVYKSVRAFRQALERSRLLKQFLHYQAEPWWSTGPYVVMEYVEGESMYGVASVIGDGRASVYDVHGMRARPGSMVVDRILFGERHRDGVPVARIARAFASIGLRRSVLYVQCVERAGKLYPIDINLRPGTLFDLAVDAFGLPFYAQALAFFMGGAKRMEFRWPSKCVGVRRMGAGPKAGVRKVVFGAGGIPLVDRLSFDPTRPYDLGHAWPTFAVLCSGRSEFDRKSEAVIEATSIRPVQRATKAAA